MRCHVSAQSFQSVITHSLSSGDINELFKNLDKRVQVSIDSKTGSYSNNQAEIILKNYLSPMFQKRFFILKQGSAKNNDADFYIGTLKCCNGEEYKVYIYSRNVSDLQLIQEIRIEKK
ncbi:MAG: DUF4783 domain-containing protein [Chitinophagales bacterium]|nr:DUF4783 domain-containing protein [Chitinophagales bacterium]